MSQEQIDRLCYQILRTVTNELGILQAKRYIATAQIDSTQHLAVDEIYFICF